MRKINRKSPLDFILPFLILLSIGVVAFLGYQLWLNFDKQGKADAYFYVVEGKAKVLPFGKSEWENGFSGTKVLLGDSLKTSQMGRLVLNFFNGTLARLGNDTSVTLNDLTKQFDSEKIVLNLNNGYLWIKGGRSQDVKEALYEVHTPHMRVKSKGVAFEVEDTDSEIVRVFEGEVMVDVMVTGEGKERLADTVTVGVGQEMVLDQATIKAYEENKSPSVLKAVDDQLKSTAWYLWNVQEDGAPTNFSLLATEESSMGSQALSGTEKLLGVDQGMGVSGSQQGQTQAAQGSIDAGTEETGSDIVDVSTGLTVPVIERPLESDRVVETGDKITISGTVGKATAKVQVEQVVNGKTEVYTLSKYVKGSLAFSYNVSEKFTNLMPGNNVYRFYAIDDKGNKSEPAEITITYDKPKSTVTGDLSAAKVISVNGGNSMTVTSGVAVITGSVSGAEKVVVNDYTLSKFVAGADSWSYTAKEALGNL
ncbi:MAG TPA: FecR domain-containing protein, partial [Candidatus Gracilibacteria bacterium]|nr:FecR domain-containing protein [Candidatus Gracilibacteria bacterium]